MSNVKSDKQREGVFTCRHCGNRTAHNLIYFHSVDVPLGFYDADNSEVCSPDYFILFECKTCKGVSLKHVFSESLDDFSSEIPYEKIDYLYPNTKEFEEEIPNGLKQVLKEADKVRHISSMAYLVLVRKVLDELCKDKNVPGRDLKIQLTNLVKLENLPSVFSDASHKLRLLGNIGAHESNITIADSDIVLVGEFIYALIEYIYVMPSKLQKLNEALNNQNQSNKQIIKKIENGV